MWDQPQVIKELLLSQEVKVQEIQALQWDQPLVNSLRIDLQ